MSGKTFLSLTCLAEAAQNPAFDNYRFIFDNGEDGALMDLPRYFGRKMTRRLEPPALVEGQPYYSKTVEELYYHLDDAVEAGKPFIYIQDSMDVLSSKQETEKFRERKAAHKKGKLTTGEMSDGKAKRNSSSLRQILPALRDTGSILIIISQTRDNLGYGFETRTRSGGRSLRFYATIEIWSSCGQAIKQTVMGKPRIIGTECILEVKKNRVTGRRRKIAVPIYYTIGIDDVGGCIDWLIEEGHWKIRDRRIAAPEFNHTGSRKALIHVIEQKNQEEKLRGIVQEVWDKIEKACDPVRKHRYE